jgi:FtsH-binding integral membrane protein
MEDILLVRTFTIIGGMLVITTIFSKINKAYETSAEAWITIIGGFLFFFLTYIYANQYPINLIYAGIFSAFLGWDLGPGIAFLGEKIKFRQYLKKIGVNSKFIYEKSTKKTHESLADKYFRKQKDFTKKLVFYYEKDSSITFAGDSKEMLEIHKQFKKKVTQKDIDSYSEKWRNIVFQALIATTLSVFLTLLVVYITDYDFGFLGIFLFISLFSVIIIELLNYFIFKSTSFRKITACVGIIIFTLYLVYDFNRLEKAVAQGDESWGTAVKIAMALYLDIINLFAYILELLSG